MAASLMGVGLVSGMLIQQGQPTPIPVTSQASDAPTPSRLDTASIYFSDLYQGAGEYPLHAWQPITVYGETFPACVVEILNGRSVFTVNPDDSRVCGDL
jgi:hypothetical protein